jgi:hypothetical protein
MIAKIFLLAKLFRAAANFLRQDRSLPDNGDAPGRQMSSDVTRARQCITSING